jgi:branched-chain amino acid transport system substrate-binding protein
MAVAQAMDLVDNVKVVALLGPQLWNLATAVLEEVTAPANPPVPEISCCASSNTLTIANDNFFRTLPPDAEGGRVLGRLSRDDASIGSVSAIYVADPYGYGNGLFNAFTQAYADVTHSMLFSQPYDHGTTDYESYPPVAAYGAGAFLIIVYPQDAPPIIQNIVNLGLSPAPKWILSEEMHDQVTIDTLGAAKAALAGAIGAAQTASTDPADIAHQNAFMRAFRGQFGPPICGDEDRNYDDVYLVAAAIQQANSTDRAAVLASVRDVSRGAFHGVDDPGAFVFGPNEWSKVLAAFRANPTTHLNYQGASGPVDLDENGDAPGYYKQWTIDGSGTIQDTGPVWTCPTDPSLPCSHD